MNTGEIQPHRPIGTGAADGAYTSTMPTSPALVTRLALHLPNNGLCFSTLRFSFRRFRVEIWKPWLGFQINLLHGNGLETQCQLNFI